MGLAHPSPAASLSAPRSSNSCRHVRPILTPHLNRRGTEMRRGTLFAVALACCAVTSCRIASLPSRAALIVAPAPGAVPAAAVGATTVDRKLMFGYQGWFGCPEDGSPLAAWEPQF